MKNEVPKIIVIVACLAISALLAGLIFTMIDDNKATYADASSYIYEVHNKNRNIEDDGWTCPACGNINDKYDKECDICGEKNPWRHD